MTNSSNTELFSTCPNHRNSFHRHLLNVWSECQQASKNPQSAIYFKSEHWSLPSCVNQTTLNKLESSRIAVSHVTQAQMGNCLMNIETKGLQFQHNFGSKSGFCINIYEIGIFTRALSSPQQLTQIVLYTSCLRSIPSFSG